MEIARSALKRITPHLGGKAREDVTPEDVRRMLAALRKSGLSDGTVSRTLDVARQLLPKAATEGVKFRIKERRRMKIATRQQAAAIEAAIDPRYSLLVRTMFTTGCRWGEAIALRGTDIEQRGTGYVLKVRRTIEEVGRKCSERGYGKTEASMRDITIPGDLALDLAGFGRELCFPGPRRLSDAVNVPEGLLAARHREGGDSGPAGPRHQALRDLLVGRARIPLGDVRDRAGHS